MSTLSGIASKGEKGKPKFQSLDINNLYRGESLEPHQQKNALPRKTGMQSLGKLPSARRPPANLPSLKSEHSGNDPAISLVPSGGSGWGASKPGETSPAPGTPAAPTTPNATVPATTTVQPPQPAATLSPVTPAAAPAAVAIVTPPTATSPGQVAHGHAHPQIHPHPQPHPHSHPHPHLGGGASSSDKSWSSIMVGGGTGGDPTNVTAPSFLAHQSPLFQQEFPSLSSGDGQGPAVGQKGGSGVVATTPSGPEAQYGPGPSLRPQTMGSWILGGSRAAGTVPGSDSNPGTPPCTSAGGDLGGGRSNLGPLGPQGAGMVPGGPGSQPNGPSSGGHPGVGPLAGQAGPIGAFRGVMPPFMYRGNFPGPFPPNFQGPAGPRPKFPYPQDGRFSAPARPQPPNTERGRGRDHGPERDGDREDDIMPRPIIKEEDLNRMDDIGRDAGWAIHDDIDYNQKLTFSDDDTTTGDDKSKDKKDGRDPRGGREDRDRDRPIDRDRDRDRDREPDKLDRDDRPREDRRSGDKRWQGGHPSGDFRSPAPLTSPLGGPGMRAATHGNRAVEDEELWREQRRKQNEQMAAIVERAKQRKEEEEKRFEERQAKAKLKLGDLESKVKDENTTSLTTSPAIAEPGDEKPLPREAAEFRQLTQIERPTFLRERERERDRDRDMRGERMSGHGEAGPQFSRQFQNNLPPRFQKQQAERHAPAAPNSNQSFDQRWALPTTNNPVVYQPGKGHGPAGRRNRSEGESPNDRDREPLDDRPPSRDPRGERDRRERHTPDANDRYRPARDRDYRNYPEGAGRKGYYEGSDYGRYGRGGDFRGPEYDRKDRDDTDPRDPRHRETWDRYDERRDPKKDYKPHAAGPDDFEDRDRERDRDRDLNRQDSGEWRDKDRDKLDRRDHRDSRERDIRDLRDLRDRDVRDPRDARDGRDVRDVRDTRDVRDPRDVRDVRDVRDPRDGRDARDTRDARDRDVREGRLARDFRDRDPREARESRDPRDRDLRDIRSDRDRDIIRDRDGPREVRDTLRDVRDRDVRDRDRDVRDIRRDPRDDRDIRDRDVRDGGARELRDVRDVRERERERDPRERDPEPRETRERGPRDRREIRGPRDVDARDLRDLRDDRPQRPDSRDSRASRESRNSRDSTREDLKLDGPSPGREFSGSWADATFDPHYESKEKKHRDFYRDRRDAADKSERKTSVETVEAWRSLPTSDLPQAEKDAPGSKAWADQLPPIDQSPSPEPVVKISEELPVADKPKAVLGPLLKEIEELTKIIDDKVVIDDVHREPRSDEDKIREDEKMDEGKPKSGRSRSGRGGRTADQARGGARQGGQGSGCGSGSYRSGRSFTDRRRGRGGGAGEWPQGSESEISADEVSVSTESGKDETRLAEGGGGRKRDRRGPRSPKSGGRKDEKDQDKPKDKDKDRPSDGGRRHDGASRGAPNDGSARDAPKDSSKEGSGREGFAPRGEPSRRGRGSLARGALGRRMDGYGPPSSKSPFGQVTSQQDKMNDGDAADPSVPNSISDGDGDKKTPSLSAGIIGSGLRTSGGPPGMSTGPGKPGSGPPGSQGPPRMNRKADGERKESRRRDGRQSTRMNKQNSVDGTEEWDSVSEGSEIDSQDVRNGGAGAGRRGFRQHPVGGSANQVQSGGGSGGRSGSGRRGGGGGGSGGSSGGNSGPGGRGEKRRDGNGGSGASQPSGNGIERRSGSGAPQTNGRGSGSRSGPPGGKPSQGTVAVNRVDEVKLNDPALVSQAISDLVKKDKEKEKTNSLEGIDLNNYASVVVVDDHPEVAVQEDTSLFDADNGFQEVRNKKTSKDMKKEEASNKGGRGKAQAQPAPSSQQPGGQLAPGQPLSGQMQTASGQGAALGQQSIQQGQQPPPLMGINTQPSGKQGFERSRSCKLPPRLAKQRENNRLQKQQAAAAQQHDVSEMNKMNQNISMYPMKDPSGPAPPPAVNAWEKPINASLRPNSPASNLSSSLQLSATITDNCIDANDHGPGSGGSSQRSSPAVDKLSREVREAREARDARDPRDPAAKDTVLDGASPPVQTIIFENTNFKQGPAATNKFPNHHKVGRIDKGRETEDSTAHQTHVSHSQHHSHGHLGLENITFPTAKTAEDGDMKLDFSFECADLQMDEKAKNMGLPRSMHSNISPSTADLNFKIASVKKVWESMPTVMEQGHGDDSQGYAPTFNSEGGLDPAAFGKAVDSPQMQMDEASEVVYSPGPPMQPNQNSYVTSVVSGVSSVAGVSAVPGMMKADPNSASPNVCKVKPQPSAVMPPGPGAGQLSPPPFNSQPASHIANFQPTMSSTAAQFGGISAIPSPPTVLYNSSQGGLYQTFLGDAQVLGGQPLGGQPLGGQPLGGQALGGQPLGGQPLGGQPLGGQPRSQFTQFTPYQLSQGLNQTSAFNQQSVYVHQSAPPPPHPPPSAAPDLYQPMSQYRLQPAAGPFGQSQQLSSNPNTVLISSSSNSLMSASVKPTSHSGQIGAIGTKGAAPGPYQAPAPQPSQLYIPYDPNQVLGVNQNFLSNSQLVQRAAPVQNMQPSSSFYSTNAGTQAGFYQAGSSLQAAPAAPQLHQTPTPFGLQSFSSHSPIAAAVQQQQQQQQYRNPQTSYLKGGLGQQAQPPPPSSPSSQQPEMLTSVFSAVPQIPSPKSRDSKRSQGQQSQSGQVGPGGQNQQSPTSQHQVDQRSGSGGPPGQQSGPQGHKFSSYQGMPQSSHMLQQNVRGNQMNMGSRGMGQSAPSRYPTPIQRPVPYSQGGMPSGNMNMNRHRTPAHNTSRPPPSMGKQGYYGSSQGGSLKMDGASSVDTKPETNNAEHKDSTPASGSVDGSAPAEAVKDDAAPPSTE